MDHFGPFWTSRHWSTLGKLARSGGPRLPLVGQRAGQAERAGGGLSFARNPRRDAVFGQKPTDKEVERAQNMHKYATITLRT